MNIELVREKFAEKFGTKGDVYASPGRINLIGEHTDYNGGFVFPGAIDKGIVAEIRPNGTDKIRQTRSIVGTLYLRRGTRDPEARR